MTNGVGHMNDTINSKPKKKGNGENVEKVPLQGTETDEVGHERNGSGKARACDQH